MAYYVYSYGVREDASREVLFVQDRNSCTIRVDSIRRNIVSANPIQAIAASCGELSHTVRLDDTNAGIIWS